LDQEKKLQFQQCFNLALKLTKVTSMFEHELKNFIKQHKEHILNVMRLKEAPQRLVMPPPDLVIFEKKQISKLYCKVAPQKKEKVVSEITEETKSDKKLKTT
jgi:hypothetical protein